MEFPYEKLIVYGEFEDPILEKLDEYWPELTKEFKKFEEFTPEIVNDCLVLVIDAELWTGRAKDIIAAIDQHPNCWIVLAFWSSGDDQEVFPVYGDIYYYYSLRRGG
jgi:hypothetical protein